MDYLLSKFSPLKKVYLIAGEPSGDLHGAHLVEAMKRLDPDLRFRGFGGPKMESAGVELDQTIDQLSFMGFGEIVQHLPTILSNFRLAKKAIRRWHPDAIVYIDFPGFNMRMAKWARKRGYTNFYYIAPQAWAWKEKRALKLRRDIDELFSILPFEQPFFARFGYEVNYVGHPLVDIIRQYKTDHGVKSGSSFQTRHLANVEIPTEGVPDRVLALLPGSRQQEVQKILPVLLDAVEGLDNYQIVIGKSPHIPLDLYHKIVEGRGAFSGRVAYEESAYRLLSKAYMACVASGTATLETALFKVPQMVCFKGSNLSYRIARRLIKVPYISLVNLVMNEEVVKELIQDELNPENIQNEIARLEDENYRDRIRHQYNLLEQKLGVGGAAEKTAKIILRNFDS